MSKRKVLNKQNETPYFTKLKKYAESNPTSFDVPGHKLGNFYNEMIDYTGQNVFKLDANAPMGLDNLSNPKGVIKEAEALMAQVFRADNSYFLINGTTSGILALIMSLVRAKQKIIMPRNVHKSVINALILSGAIPIFMKPEIDKNLGIANGVSLNEVKRTISENPDAKAIFIINPTYFGVVSPLEEIIKIAHESNMKVIVDEAHGGHFYFSNQLPIGAIAANADAAVVSIHKTLGSLTQSSIILTKGININAERLRSTLNILNSTSPSSLLIASLDVARKNIYFNGKEKIENIIKLAKKARKLINEIPGIKAITPDYFLKQGASGYDQTKVLIKVSDLGVSGFEIYKEIREDFNIQLELAETHLVLAILTPGTTNQDIDNLVFALLKISEKYFHQKLEPIKPKLKMQSPDYYMRPREAYHGYKKFVTWEEAIGEVSAESIMVYPPGIPIVIPGEVISDEIIEALKDYEKSGSTILSDTGERKIKVVDLEKSGWEEDDI